MAFPGVNSWFANSIAKPVVGAATLATGEALKNNSLINEGKNVLNPNIDINGRTNPVLDATTSMPSQAPGVIGTDGNGFGGTSAGATGGGSALTAQQQAFQNSFQPSLQNIRQTYGVDPFTGAQINLQGTAQNLFNTQRAGQTQIDQSRANNELSRQNGIQDILSYVRNGMQQGGSRLAANNATESSASGALARAYNQIGNQKARSVNNQAGLQGAQLDQSQQQLDTQTQNGVTDFHRTRDNLVNDIGSQLRYQLAALDSQAAGLSLPDRIAVDQEKQALIDQGQQKLQQVDQWLQDQLGTINPQSQDQVLAAAQGLRQAGTASPNPFNPGQFDQQQVQGPAIDQLPLFTRNKKIQ